jgi:hypothetical protein
VTVRRLWIPVLGLVCSVILVIGILSRLPASAHQLSHRRTAAQSAQVIDGIPVTGGLPAQTPDFVHRARELVPDHGKIRVLVGPERACSSRPGQLFWFAYQLLPRITVCDPSTRYWMLVHTGPVTLPPGSRVVLEPTPELRFVDTRPDAS